MTVERDEDGKWLPGVSANPGGRSKSIATVIELARAHTADAIRTLSEIMLDKKAPESSRVAAANALIDRGYGRPLQSFVGELSTPVQIDDLSETEIARRVAFVLERGLRKAQELGAITVDHEVQRDV